MSDPKDHPVSGTPEWYRAQARRFTDLAAMAVVPQIKIQLMTIVREYEVLAQKASKDR
jgi:hypothetical protein